MKIIITLIFVSCYLAGCNFDDESSAPPAVLEEPPFEVSVSIYDLEGDLEFTLNENELLLITDSDNSNKIETKFIGRFNQDQPYSVKVSQQPNSQYCHPRYSKSKVNGRFNNENINIRFDCQAYFRGLTGVSEVSVGNSHTCSIVNNQVSCWGDNSAGQLNIPDNINNPRMMSSGSWHTCVLEDEGVVCWGNDRIPSLKQPPQKLVNVKELKSGAGFSCVIDDNGLQCWGEGNVVSAGLDLVNPHSLTADHTDACVIDEDKLFCWGPYSDFLPVFFPDASSIMLGFRGSSCITNLQSEITCYTVGNYIDESASEIQLTSDSIIETGDFAHCALSAGSLHCWGNDYFGLTDIQYIIDYPSVISVGHNHACAIEVDELICVGSNSSGKIEIPQF